MGPEFFSWEQSAEKLELISYSAVRTWAEKWLSGRLCALPFSVWVVAVSFIPKMSISIYNSHRCCLYWYQDPEGHIYIYFFFPLKRTEEDKEPSQFNPVFWKVTSRCLRKCHFPKSPQGSLLFPGKNSVSERISFSLCSSSPATTGKLSNLCIGPAEICPHDQVGFGCWGSEQPRFPVSCS